MSVAHSTSNSQRDLVAQLLQLMLLAVAALLELFLAACKLYPTFLNQLVETMVILTTVGRSIVVTTLPAIATVNPTVKAKQLLTSNQPYQCITAAL